MEPQLDDEIAQFLRSINSTNQKGATDQQESEEIIDVYFVRREAEIAPESDIVDAAPVQSNGPSVQFTMSTVCFCVGILFSAIAFQLFLAFNPPIAVVVVIPKTQIVALTGTLPLGRLLPPIRLYQSQSVVTTGHGHQDATRAAGELVVYNGQSTEQTIPAGTIFTGADSVQIATDETVTIPAGNPPTYGQATVSAHAASTGAQGNITPGDINATVTIAVIAKNTAAFTGGQDERTFPIVTHRDIETTAAPLKATLASAMQGALQGELKSGEVLLTLPCLPSLKSDHQAGDEAAQVTVTVVETCTSVAFDVSQLRAKAAQLLSYQASKELGSGYSLVGNIEVTDIRATFPHETPVLTYSSKGTFVYALSNAAQERMRSLIAGRVPQEALHMLSALPGVQSASLQWSGDTKLPKDIRLIHFVIVIPSLVSVP
jgi:hypothetical protein